MLTLYTAPTGNGRKPTLLLKLLNLDYKLNQFEWPTTEIKQEWYLKLNPNGTIPTLVDGDLTLYESNAILEYISENYDKDLKFTYSKGSINYWLIHQWLFYQSSNFAGTMSQTNRYLKYNPNDEWSRNVLLNDWIKIYTVLDGHLKKNKSGWFVGDKFTIADLALAVGNHRRVEKTTGTKYEIEKFDENFPNVKKWYDRVLEIEGVKDILN
ncbi:unnamed protein product [Candida verbasci]|uniref:Glutathione S-transferase n=1 Tax=Candida verbasci TaxID=1227364 RepID=A0A9W4TTG5_9ASCO|nr:unnamed protein product [Candida verbasci]